MTKLPKQRFICIIITGVFLLIFLHLTRVDKTHDAPDAAEKLTRDFVLSDIDDGSQKSLDEIKKEIVPTKKNNVNLYEDKNKNKLLHKPTDQAFLKTWNGKKKIFVHPSEKDTMISARLKDFGTWEEDLLNQTGMFIRQHPGMTFVDLGCNIGVYTLFVSALGVRVVAVEPLEDNLGLLEMTSRAGGFTNNVTLVLNAISDKYQTVSVETPRDNVGGAHIIDKIPSSNEAGHVVLRETILLNDLVPFIKDDSVFIKMDIEGHEWNALKGSKHLFQSKNVRGILMEWVHHRHTNTGQYIIDFLLKEGLLPYTDVTMNKMLDFESYYEWPENIFWIKR